MEGPKLKTLALDLSTTDTGFAIYENSNLILWGSLSYKDKDVYDRIFRMVNKIHEMIIEEEIDEVVFEDSFSGTNKQVVVKLNRLAGGVIFVSKTLSTPFITYAPRYIKKEFTGNGNASKQEVIDKVKEIFNLDIKNDNICDAIALGYIHVK